MHFVMIKEIGKSKYSGEPERSGQAFFALKGKKTLPDESR
jgi:hypothetical protein